MQIRLRLAALIAASALEVIVLVNQKTTTAAGAQMMTPGKATRVSTPVPRSVINPRHYAGHQLLNADVAARGALRDRRQI